MDPKSGVVSTASALAAAAGQAATAVEKKQGSGKVAQVDGQAVEAVSGSTETVTTKAKKAKKAAAKPNTPKATETEAAAAATTETEKKESPKLTAARKCFDANKKDKEGKARTAGEIAGIMKDELKISYSNAYYYVTRVFGMKSSKSK